MRGSCSSHAKLYRSYKRARFSDSLITAPSTVCCFPARSNGTETTIFISINLEMYLERIWRRSRLVSRSWSTSCREVSVDVSCWMFPPPRRTCCRYPVLPVVGPRPSGCRPGSSHRGCSRLPAAQEQQSAVLARNSRGRRRNRGGSRRPRDPYRVHGCRDPRQCHCLRGFTTCQISI